MLYVDRASVPMPSVLFEGDPRSGRARLLAQKHFSKPVKQRRQIRFKFDTNILASRDLRETLAALFKGKCAYCESVIGVVAAAEVNRFRPRSFARSPQGVTSNDHYWWLAYEWSNLYAACAVCSRNKGSRFPVQGRRAAFGVVGEALRSGERPMLVDPCGEDPDEHLAFDDSGSVAGRTPRGQATIDVLGLNRPELVVARQRELSALLNELKRESSQPGEPGWVAVCKSAIRDDRQPYLGAKRQLVARELRRRSGLKAKTLSVDDVVQHLAGVAGAQVSLAAIRGIVRALPSVVMFGSQIRKLVSSSLAEERSDPAPEVNSDEVDPSYFAKTRLVESIEITNFRKIESLRLDLTKSQAHAVTWTMLLGENGVGKSSILQAVALALVGEGYVRRLGLDPASLVRKGARRAKVSIRLTNTPDPVVFEVDPKAGFASSESRPKVLVLGYGATRLMPRPGMSAVIETSSAKVDNLFNPFVPVGNAEAWLRSLPKARFDDYARALKELFLVLDGPEKLVRRGSEILVETRLGTVPLSHLSDGYQSVIGVTADVMRVMSRHWPQMEVAEGLVLIDELGSHLHPRWRMRVVSGLRGAFPRVQFITSSHDPLCLRGLEAGEVIVLREDHRGETFAIGDAPPPQSMTVEQLLTSEHFGLHSTIDPAFDARFAEYLELKASGGQADVERLRAIRTELDAEKALGKDRRERLMLEVIDDYLAQDLTARDPERRRTSRLETKRKVANAWRNVLPEPTKPVEAGDVP